MASIRIVTSREAFTGTTQKPAFCGDGTVLYIHLFPGYMAEIKCKFCLY